MDKNFDWETYIRNYEDLQKAGINNADKAWSHWVKFGISEGRTFTNLNVNMLKLKQNKLAKFNSIIKILVEIKLIK
jgi:hypothetical protein